MVDKGGGQKLLVFIRSHKCMAPRPNASLNIVLQNHRISSVV